MGLVQRGREIEHRFSNYSWVTVLNVAVVLLPQLNEFQYLKHLDQLLVHSVSCCK